MVIGFPFDGTTAHRPGSRFGPSKLREASMVIESISLLTKINTDAIPIHDAGDVAIVHGDPKESLRRLREAVSIVVSRGKIPLIIGGEHIATLGTMEAMYDLTEHSPPLLVYFDAHMDLYEEWPPGQEISYATTLRRLCERIGPSRVLLLGVRACSPEELDFAQRNGIRFITSFDLMHDLSRAISRLRSYVKDSKIYLSIDLDVLDPGVMPAVSDPEAGGLDYMTFVSLLRVILCSSRKLLGADIVELNPLVSPESPAPYIASRVLMELIALDYSRIR